MAAKLVQIVPALPPIINGVGDYAFLLAGELNRSHAIKPYFLVSGHDLQELLAEDAMRIQARESGELVEQLNRLGVKTVLLHYVGYAYQKRGCPVWLVKGLERWLRSDPRCRLVTMFHELYASGPPWRSSFWSSPLQVFLAAKLAKLSVGCVTNLRKYAEKLERWSLGQDSHVTVKSVFSNVGEPELIPDYSSRKSQMIVFGGASWRRLAYTRYVQDLRLACHSLKIQEVVDIGPENAGSPSGLPGFTRFGPLPPEKVSRLMLYARAGFFSYPVSYLGKSGIFASYAAHGLAPVTFEANAGEPSELVSPPVWARADAIDLAAAAKLSAAAREWYSNHSIAAHGNAFARALLPGVSVG